MTGEHADLSRNFTPRLHGVCQPSTEYKVAFFPGALRRPWEPVFIDFTNGATYTDDGRASTDEMSEAQALEDGANDGEIMLTILVRWIVNFKMNAGGATAGDPNR